MEHILNILLSIWKNSSLEEISFENIEESSLITEIFKSNTFSKSISIIIYISLV